jgi:hypothetical protein
MTFSLSGGEKGLAATVPNLDLVERCRCGDDFCSTIYTRPKPKGRYGQSHRSFDLDAETGMIILDVVDSEIVCVEILFRDDVRRKLLEILP